MTKTIRKPTGQGATQRKQTRPRRKLSFTPQEIQGLKIVGRILNQTRLTRPEGQNSLRGFQALVEEKTGEYFEISAIRRYEKAGEPQDHRSNSRGINQDYLSLVAPMTGFPYEALRKLCLGDFGFLSDGPTLSELIAAAEDRLRQRFENELKKWDISPGELDLARQGILVNRVEAALSGLLGIPVNEVIAAALRQLRQDYPEDPNAQ